MSAPWSDVTAILVSCTFETTQTATKAMYHFAMIEQAYLCIYCNCCVTSSIHLDPWGPNLGKKVKYIFTLFTTGQNS